VTDDVSGAEAAASTLPDEETLLFSGAEGESAGGADAGTPGVDTFGVWDLLRMILVLLMVVGAIYGLISLLRRRVNRTEEEDDSPIRVLASRSVGTGQIHAVMVGQQVLLLGGGDSGLELITRVEDQETIDELVLAHSAGAGGKTQTFGAVLGRWIGNLAVPGSGNADTDANGAAAPGDGGPRDYGVSFFRSQTDRLRKLR